MRLSDLIVSSCVIFYDKHFCNKVARVTHGRRKLGERESLSSVNGTDTFCDLVIGRKKLRCDSHSVLIKLKWEHKLGMEFPTPKHEIIAAMLSMNHRMPHLNTMRDFCCLNQRFLRSFECGYDEVILNSITTSEDSF